MLRSERRCSIRRRLVKQQRQPVSDRIQSFIQLASYCVPTLAIIPVSVLFTSVYSSRFSEDYSTRVFIYCAHHCLLYLHFHFHFHHILFSLQLLHQPPVPSISTSTHHNQTTNYSLDPLPFHPLHKYQSSFSTTTSATHLQRSSWTKI